MAGSLTQYGEKLLLEYSIGRFAIAPAVPTTNGLFLALCKGAYTNLETGSQMAFIEVEYGGYLRQQLVPANWGVIDQGASQSKLTYNAKVTFPQYPLTTQQIVTYLVLYTQQSEGSPVWYTEISGDGKRLTLGDVLEVNANSLVITLT